MANFTLTEVEGGAAIPKGSIVTFPSTYPSVFTLEGAIYSTDGVPGRVIPTFDTDVDPSIKGMVNDHTLCTVNISTSGSGNTFGAGGSSDGTLIRAVIISGSLVIDRKLPNEDMYSNVLYLGNQYTQSNAPSRVVTDNAGTWVIFIGVTLAVSKDNGATWRTQRLGDATSNICTDLKYSTTTGTYIACLKPQTGGAEETNIYRSKDGIAWNCVSNAAVATVAYTTGTTWFGISAGSTTTYTSTDDGLTWGTSATLPFTPVSNAYQLNLQHSNGRFYFIGGSVSSLYSGPTLASLTTVTGGDGLALAVDNSGNSFVLRADGAIAYSNNGAAQTTPANKIKMENINNTVRYGLTWANGTLVFPDGSYVSVANFLSNSQGNKTQVLRVTPNFACKVVDSFNGVAIVNLNANSYLRTTDGWKTCELRNYNVATQAANSVSPSGCATDGFGNWVVTFYGTPTIYYSVDNGLTWATRNTSGGATITGVVGGKVSGAFLMTTATNTAYITTNTFSSSTAVTGIGNNMFAGNPVTDREKFYYVTFITATNKLGVNIVDPVAGTLTTVEVDYNVDTGYGVGYPLLNYGSALIYKDIAITGAGLGKAVASKYSVVIQEYHNGVPSQSGTLGNAAHSAESTLLMAVSPSDRRFTFGTIGIKDMGLPSTSYIKVR